GCYLTLATERFAGRSTVRLFVATGFLGAYTTFSTFSYEAVSLARHGAVGAAVAYAVASLALGLAAVVAGILAARALRGCRWYSREAALVGVAPARREERRAWRTGARRDTAPIGAAPAGVR